MGLFDTRPEHTISFEMNPNENPLNWTIAVLMFLLDIFQIFLCVSLISPLNKFLTTSTKKPKCTVLCSTMTIFFFCISSILITTSTILILLSGDYHHTIVANEIFTKSGLILYLLSQTLLIFVFNIRIDETFSGSVIQYSKRCIHSLYISTFLFFAFCIIFIFSLILEVWQIFATFSIIWILLYFCLSIVLCVLFVRKIELLIVYCSGDYALDPALLHLVIKHAILVPICIGTSLFCLILFILINYIIAPGELVPSAVMWTVVDCAMSSIGIFLLFAWNKKYYDRFCGKLHRICEKRDILQLAKSHSKRVTKERKKRSESATDRSTTKTKSNRDTQSADAPSLKTSGSRSKSKTNATQPVLNLVGSIKAQLSNKKSIKKDGALETSLIHEDDIALRVGNDANLSEIDMRRLKLIEEVTAGENEQNKD